MSVKGIGNYSSQPVASEERRVGLLVKYLGGRAMVRFPGALAYAMPEKLFKLQGIAENQHFVMVIPRLGHRILDVRVEPHAAARPPMDRKATPKVLIRNGRRLGTRR